MLGHLWTGMMNHADKTQMRESGRNVSIDGLIRFVDEQFRKMLQSNLQELNISRIQVQALYEQKKELKQMLRRCGTGDATAKQYVKQTIGSMLLEQFKLTQEEMELLLPVQNPQKMTARDMFEVMLCCYKRTNGKGALEIWITEHMVGGGQAYDDTYEITESMVRNSYRCGRYPVTFQEWLELIVQRVYAEYRGLGVIDEIRDMDIDGVSGGVSGLDEEESSVWIMFHGKTIHLSFLKFGSSEMLQKVCRRICRYGHSGQLSRAKGYMVNEMADHARVVVARPDFSENWVFFVRKFDNLKHHKLERMFGGDGVEAAIFFLQYIVKGAQTIGITGAQGSGKTTLLMALTAYIPGSFTLRIQETAFELQLRRLYPQRNIVSFRETESVSAQEGLDLQKKTDGTVSIVGEVANDRQAALMLQTGQAASLFTMFTHHANSTRHLVHALQNSLLQTGRFSKEEIAQRQVIEVVRFHVHLQKTTQGERYIDYISELIPLDGVNENYEAFEERVLVRRKQSGYEVCAGFSDAVWEQMMPFLTEKERAAYDETMLCYAE